MSRVAPTAKIPDDAPFPPGQLGSPSQPPHNNYQSAPASIPPQNHGPASIPPNSYIAPQYGTGPASIPPRAASIPPISIAPPTKYRAPSLSIPVPAQPRWGLIAFLVILDLGLAGAGGFLLWKGLAKPEVVEDVKSSAGPAKAAVVVPAPAPPNLAASVTAITQQEPVAAPAPVAQPVPPVPVAKKSAPKPKSSAPEDPYDPKVSLAAEIELAASRSKDAFGTCHAHAGGEIHGRIDVQFTVETDGSVKAVKVTQNTTHSDAVADCIVQAIRGWSFASHPANPTDIVRPFIYN